MMRCNLPFTHCAFFFWKTLYFSAKFSYCITSKGKNWFLFTKIGNQLMTESIGTKKANSLELVCPREGYEDILNKPTIDFLQALCNEFGSRIEDLLSDRIARQEEFDNGRLPDFLEETKEIRDGTWKVSRVPEILQDRRVEITGPVDRKMIINALNSGAKVYMADFEDSSSPTWSAMMDGQVNLKDATSGTIEFTNEVGKKYRLAERTATLIVRPRGLHLKEKGFLSDSNPVPAALIDFGLFFFHNGKKMYEADKGPFFYLPKLESYLEARLWNDVFVFAQNWCGIPQGTLKATVLIETIPAVFQMNEILWELKEHVAGLNCGRWDYIFSFIKCFRKNADFVLPDRKNIGMDVHFLNSYSKLLVQTCHKRGAHAMGGMAAQIPIKDDKVAHEAAIDKVRKDKEREALNGHDGTWVAHPGLIPVAMEIFEKHLSGSNQINEVHEGLEIKQEDLLAVPEGEKTINGFRTNISAALRYIEEWLRGVGCVPLNHLMEDAATAEISRAQIWQWVHHSQYFSGGQEAITLELFKEELGKELKAVEREFTSDALSVRKFSEAAKLLSGLVEDKQLAPFLTLEAYHLI